MGNFKKISAVVVSLAITLTTLVPAFAATYTTVNENKAVVLNKLELYAGTSTSSFVPSLETELTRGQGAILLTKQFNMDDAALALTDAQADAILKDFADADKVPSYAKKRLAYLVQNNIMSGSLDAGKLYINADKSLLGGQFATLVLKQMGFTVPAWNEAISQLSVTEGAKDVAAYASYANNALLRDQAVGIIYGSLTAKYANGQATIIEKIVAAKPAIAAEATTAGLYTAPVPVTSKALDIKSAVAISSNTVEVVLNAAPAAADVVTSNVAVTDNASKAVAVKAIELAGWDADGKTVLVSLDANTSAGTLYTIKSGTDSANFGGKSTETVKPTVTSVAPTDYNQVKVTFSEAVKLNGASIALTEKYGTKAALNVIGVKYGAKNEIIVTTAEQKTATLYGATVTGVSDFCGNVMEKDEAKTFVGIAKDTTDLKVTAAASVNPDEVTVKFNVPVDTATILPANFAVTEMYGNKATLTVTAARLANVDEIGVDGIALTDTTRKNQVVLTVAGQKDATLYKVKSTNVATLYGKALSTTDSETYKTFVGKAIPTTVMNFAANAVEVISNTEVKVSFDRKINAATVAAANFAIKQAYGTTTELAVSSATLNDDKTSVTLKVGSTTSGTLFKMTVSNIKDIYGNALKTENSYNIVSFAGKSVATKISKIDSIVRSDATTITVNFDVNVGKTVTDVSHYTIDNGIGYPEKAEVTTNADEVKLTIPTTVNGKVYKLTVKGLENADGVAMDADGINKTFVGQGVSSTLPEIEAIVASDNQTLKIYFDRDVTDTTMSTIWNKDTHAIVAGALKYSTTAAVPATLLTGYAYQDEVNTNALIVRAAAANTFKAASLSGTTVFTMGYAASTVYNTTNMVFAPNDTVATNPEIIAVAAENNKTLIAYFSEAVAGVASTDFVINKAADGTGIAGPAVTSVYKVDAKTYKVGLATALTNETYFLRVADVGVDANGTIATITDASSYVEIAANTASTTAADYTAIQFAGSSTDAGIITTVPVTMTNDRIMTVWYPEAMTTTGGAVSVLDVNNYEFLKGDMSTALVTAANVTDLAWDADTNSVKITFNVNLADSANGYFVRFANTLANATGIKLVKADAAGTKVVAQFAKNTVAADKVEITETAFTNNGAGVADTLKITFNQAVKTDANLTSANIVNYLKLNVPGVTAADISSIAMADVDAAAVADSSANYIKSVTITFAADKATAGTTGDVAITNSVATVGFKGINGYNGNIDLTVPFAQ